MIPVKLSLSGFISYRDLVEVDFNGFDLACISGANGAGKSSLLDGITWALFGKARKTDDSIINSGSERAEVEFTFSYESTIYRVQRVKTKGKTTILEFHIQNKDGKWKALTDRTLRGTEALIVKTLSLDYDTFINASFFLQGKADQFTQQTAANRKAILGSVLGLEIWEEYRKTAADERKLVDQKITNLDGRLQEINAELDQEAERNTRLVDLEKTLKQASQSRSSHEKVLEGIRGQAATLSEQSKLVETLKTQAERARQALEDQKSKLEARQGDKAKYAGIMSREKEIQQANKELAAIRKELESWEETRANFDEHDKRRNAPLTDIETARAR
ncbi:MAG: SMC family ATPase, partial [Anaerolineae bacterium]|nr:SMC family ATPase [Anaerolineae bacterium]